jgi:hypothetical protein
MEHPCQWGDAYGRGATPPLSRLQDGMTQAARQRAGRSSWREDSRLAFIKADLSVDGTHHHVSDFRYTTRKINDSERMKMLMDTTGARRLTYKPLTNGD